MWRGPEKYDGKQDERAEAKRAGYRSPPNQGRGSTRGTANDDVLFGSSLQPKGVDEHVEETGPQCQNCGKPIYPQQEQTKGQGL